MTDASVELARAFVYGVLTSMARSRDYGSDLHKWLFATPNVKLSGIQQTAATDGRLTRRRWRPSVECPFERLVGPRWAVGGVLVL